MAAHEQDDVEARRRRWGSFRFAVVGPLLAQPPERGELLAELDRLAARPYRHPTTGETVRFAAKTLERWYYTALHAPTDPVAALARKVHARAGTHPSMPRPLLEVLRAQYRAHPSWSRLLHHDNLRARADAHPELGEVPSYSTLCRVMTREGLHRQRRRRGRKSPLEAPDFEPREVRSFEVRHVCGLWHFDFHECPRAVVDATGTWSKPWLFGCLDDRSRLVCHAQWYAVESAETAVHGLTQALRKRGLPRAILSDNGGAQLAAETTQGFERLGILHRTTLPQHPEQNGKQETFWQLIDGHLVAMLEGEQALTLELLNEATQAWVELHYHRRIHRELAGQSPLEAWVAGPSVGRPAPSLRDLRRAFRRQVGRTVRRSDATVTVHGVRFELPGAYRAFPKVQLRVAQWDLSTVDLVDPRTGTHLAVLHPLDKHANAEQRRRRLDRNDAEAAREATPPDDGIAPHLRALMAEYAATGLPPAYLAGPSGDGSPSEDPDDEYA